MARVKQPAPKDYTELFERYFEYAKSVVAQHGIDSDNVEDVAQELFLRFLDKDALSWYDPDKVFDTRQGPRTASFTSLFKRFLSTYVLQYRDKQATLKKREPVRNEMPVGHDGGPAMWVEVHGPVSEIDEERVFTALDLPETLRAAHEHLKSLPIKGDGKRDLARFFRLVVQRALAGKETTGSALAKSFGVSDTVVYSMFQEMRRELSGLGFDQWLREAIAA